MPNKLSQFWQELKRRNVVRVITVYAGAAFVIIELINNITEPLRLPEWTPTFVIVLLALGFPIAIIFSWIYDIHPKEGVVKTEASDKIKVDDIPRSSNSWKIASYISFVVIVGLIILNIFPRLGKKEILDTSVAVLPLVNLSSNDDISSIGYTNEIIMELQKIKAFSRVLSLTSTMQFAEHQPTIPEIGQKLNVNYIIEGTIQKQHDRISIIIQVISAKEDDHIWAKEFKDAWENRFNLQDKIALVVAEQLKAVITPEEKQRIEKKPTSSLTAYDFYQRARAEHERSAFDRNNRGGLERAKDLYNKALEYDSTFALAYTGLALIYWSEHFFDIYSNENYLDTLQIFADKALSFDDQLSDAYIVKGLYHHFNNKSDQAISEIDRAIRFNPNNWLAYYVKGSIYSLLSDYRNSIENLYNATSLYRGALLHDIYGKLADSFSGSGFRKIGEKYLKEALALDDDSASYYSSLAASESSNGNFKKSIELYMRANEVDPTKSDHDMMIGNNYLFLGLYEEALEHYKKCYDKRQAQFYSEHMSAGLMLRIGESYLYIGKEETAVYYLNRVRELYNELNALGRMVFLSESTNIYEHLLWHAILGEKDKAFEYLSLYHQSQYVPLWLVIQMKVDPGFNSIRTEPEFQQILQDVEVKYQAEHERVRQWLEENEML